MTNLVNVEVLPSVKIQLPDGKNSVLTLEEAKKLNALLTTKLASYINSPLISPNAISPGVVRPLETGWPVGPIVGDYPFQTPFNQVGL